MARPQEVCTKKQRSVLEAVRRVMEREGLPPTTRELARMLKLDVKSIGQHLERLEQRGLIFRRPRESRNIRLTEKGRAVAGARPAGVPLVGQIAAGQPVLAEENLEGYVAMDDFFGRDGGLFLLRVRGDSMEGAGIRDGDVVAVQGEAEVKNGDIAVVVLGGEATVKRFRRKGKMLLLEPENPAYETIEVDAGREEIRVVGPVTGLIRRI